MRRRRETRRIREKRMDKYSSKERKRKIANNQMIKPVKEGEMGKCKDVQCTYMRLKHEHAQFLHSAYQRYIYSYIYRQSGERERYPMGHVKITVLNTHPLSINSLWRLDDLMHD